MLNVFHKTLIYCYRILSTYYELDLNSMFSSWFSGGEHIWNARNVNLKKLLNEVKITTNLEKNKFICVKIAILQFWVPIACKKYGLLHNNNPIERYNWKIKDRIKNIRSGFKNFNDAECFDLRRIIHNSVNPNQELQRKTPAEIAEIHLRFGRNKLLDLIKYLRDNYIILSWQYLVIAGFK